MTFDPTKPCTTRDGCAVVIYCTDAPGIFPIHGRIDGGACPSCWGSDGRRYPGEEREFDLINVPPPKRVIYRNFYGLGSAYTSRAEADAAAAPGRIACVRIEEGQFDE